MKKHALIVDDSSTARHLLGRMLKKLDFEIIQASSGEQALDALRVSLPDIVFLDHIMPGLNGFEVLRAIKGDARTANIPVVMYTSQAANKYKLEAIELGASGVISKQLDETTLYTTVEDVLHRHQAPTASSLEQDRTPPGSMTGTPSPQVEPALQRASIPAKDEGSINHRNGITANPPVDSGASAKAEGPATTSWWTKVVRIAVVLLLIFLFYQISSLTTQIERQQAQMELVLEQMELSRNETQQAADSLLAEINQERALLKEERVIVTELILTFVEELELSISRQLQENGNDAPDEPTDVVLEERDENESDLAAPN